MMLIKVEDEMYLEQRIISDGCVYSGNTIIKYMIR